MSSTDRPRILVVGGGYVGLYAAQRILKKMRYGEATVTVVDPRSYMTYQPFLPEAAAGSLSPRHVVVPLRRVLPRAEIINGRVTSIDQETKTAQVEPLLGESYELGFDFLVIALGSISRTFPIPGLAENGIGFKTIEEAIALRNRVLAQLDVADSATDPELRRRALTFCFVGGGFAGVEALAEIEDMARDATRYYKNVTRDDMRFVMVEAMHRILPEVGDELGKWTLEKLRKRGIEFYLETSLQSCVDKHCVLSDGTEFDASTIVWTAGVKPNPALARFGLPLGPRGHVDTRPTLQVAGLDHVFAAGDNAQVPDLASGEGAWCPPNAQHAVRQAVQLGDNLVSVMRGFPPKEYKHKNLGAVAGLGLHKGVAIIGGKFKLKGLPAWIFHRTYHMYAMPTFNRKSRIVADWTLAMFFRREIVSLGSIEHPRDEFAEAALPPKPRAEESGQIPTGAAGQKS